MQKVKVCDDNWHGNKKEEFQFENFDSAQATVSRLGHDTWPFQEGPPIYVPGKGPAGPGTKICHLADLPNDTYHYYVDICKTEGESKNVTIP